MLYFYHFLVLSGLLGVSVLMLTNLLVYRTARPRTGASPRSVSVLIPARNEAARIGPCLASLISQEFAGEIIVLDDQSEDNTQQIAESYGFRSEAGSRLRIICGQPLPVGWTGKCWACHQLAEHASGEFLLFTDADTMHLPGSVAGAVAYAEKTGAGLLSAWPLQITRTLSEKMIISLGHLLILGFLPQSILFFLQRSPHIACAIPPRWLAALGAANGQHLLFRRATYEKIGGHAAVRNQLVEDLELGRLVAAHTASGERLVNCDGSQLLQCRMYNCFEDIREGFTKNIRPAFQGGDGAFLLALFWQATVFVSPFFALLLWPSARALAGIEVVCILLLRLLPALRFGGTVVGTLLHPAGYIAMIYIALRSWRLWNGQGVRWKGRTYMASDKREV